MNERSKVNSKGRKIKTPTLRQHEEEEILQFISEKTRKGERVLRQDIIQLVVKFIQSDQRRNPFRDGIPGDKWFCLFRRRHNNHFIQFQPEVLLALENVGFSEKVLNTVLYTNPSRSTISVRNRLLSSERRRKKTTQSSTPILARDPILPRKRRQKQTTQSPTTAVLSPPASEESCHISMTDDMETSRSQESQSGTPDFRPGSKLEVMDFNEKWYPVKVIEVDYEEGEVLVHFEKWSDIYDEWVSMDSNRIRQPVLSPTSVSKKVFEVNEKVIAVWAYNHKYPATVRKVLQNDKYEVLFSDGYAKIVRGCKLFKATEEDLKNVKLPPPKKPAPPMGADPLDPDLGPKEERRLKKRRLDVLEAYLPHKKPKIETQSSSEPVPQPVSQPVPQPSTSSYQPKEMPKVVLKARGRPPIKRKFKLPDDDDDDDDMLVEEEEEEEEEEEKEEQVQEVVQEEVIQKKRRGRKKKLRVFDESKYVYRPKIKSANNDVSEERWNTEIPKGASPVEIKDQKGCYRKSVIIPDKKLPEGWTKHTLRRKKGAKWDVILVNPDGRKFRSRSDLRNYFAEKNKPFPDDSFDFMVGRKKEMIKSQEENRKKMFPSGRDSKALPVHKLSDGEGSAESKKTSESTPDSKRIKTMLPKSRLLDTSREYNDESPDSSPSMNKLSSPPFTLSDVRNSDGGFTCCGKSFRKENLFQMHMKHYHPEYSNLFGSTPNVADLAYARTVGEPLEDSRAEAMTPKNSLAERVTKYEAERTRIASSDISSATATSPDTSATANDITSAANSPLPEPVLEPLRKIVVEQKSPIQEALPSADIKDSTADLTSQELVEEKTSLVTEEKKEDNESETLKEEKLIAAGMPVTSVKEEKIETSDVLPSSPTLETQKDVKPCEDKVEEFLPMAPEVALPIEPIPSPPPQPSAVPSTSTNLALPVIKPVSKMTPGSSKTSVTSEAVTMQTTTSTKSPVTITKYIPPGQKQAFTTTKVTISVPATEKETKPTIKTLLPMRPPPAEPKESQEMKAKEDKDEETPVKSKPRKRTVSESLPKKPKLVKPSTGSLEEEPDAGTESPLSSTINNTSYRFSRNRTMPRVTLENMNITSDKNGHVVVSTPEDKITKMEGRRLFKNFKDAHKIIKKPKGVEGVSGSVPGLSQQALENDTVFENLRKEEIINCTCGYMEEDGLMIQCDLCLCWQHGMCNNIDKEADVPDKYVCYICQHPPRQRISTVHRHNQDWLKEGQLPSLTFRSKNSESVTQRETMLKKSHDLVSSLLQLKTVIHSLRVKTHIAMKPDHPKLYLWAKSWKNDNSSVKVVNDGNNLKQEVSGPQPEAAIDETECRLQLLEHVEDYQHQVDDRLTSIQAQIAALESEDPDLASDEASDYYPVTKQTVQMVLRDLNTARKVAALN